MPDYGTMEAMILGVYDKTYVTGKGNAPSPQGTLDFSKPAANDEDRIKALENRVASLEQLIIRRGIA